MKKRLFLASLVAIVMSLVACNKEEVDATRFMFDADGKCYQPNTTPISHAEFLKYAEGNAWEYVSAYEIKDDGSVSDTDFHEGLASGIIASYIGSETFFTSQKSLHLGTIYFLDAYVYSEKGNMISFERSDGSLFDKYQVLSIDGDEIQMISNEGLRSHTDARPTYTLTTFQKMTDEAQAAFRKKYDEYVASLP